MLERDKDSYRPWAAEFDSDSLAALAAQNGFVPFNEYMHESKFQTGQHMHVEMT